MLQFEPGVSCQADSMSSKHQAPAGTVHQAYVQMTSKSYSFQSSWQVKVAVFSFALLHGRRTWPAAQSTMLN